MFGFWTTILIALVVIFIYQQSKKPTKTQNTELNRYQIADKLQEFASMNEYSKERGTYLAIAEALRTGGLPEPQSDKSKTLNDFDKPEGQYAQVDNTKSGTIAPQTATQATSTVVSGVTSEAKPHKEINPFELLQNINILLYIGAFLVVVSAAILVGTNFDAFSGSFKFVLVAIFAALFYGLGMFFYMRLPKLKPAGTTFSGIGILMVPFIAVAYRNFVNTDVDIASLWLITSLIALIIYAYTYFVMRAELLEYLVLLTVVSSVGSGLLSAELPIYWLGWSGVILAMLFQFLSEYAQRNNQPSKSSLISAQILVPIALLFGFGDVIDETWIASVTLTLAGTFYALSSLLRSIPEDTRPTLLVLGQLLWVGAVVAIVHDFSSELLVTSIGLVALGSAYLVLAGVFKHNSKRPSHFLASAGMAIAVFIGSWLPVLDKGGELVGIISATLVLSLAGFFVLKRAELFFASLAATLLLPIAIFVGWLDLSNLQAMQGLLASYGVISTVLFATSLLFRQQQNSLQTASHIAIAAGMLVTVSDIQLASVLFAVYATIFEAVVVWNRKEAQLLLVPAILWHVSIMIFSTHFELSSETIVWILAASASVWFGVGAYLYKFQLNAKRYAEISLAVGAVVLLSAWVWSLANGGWQFVSVCGVVTIASFIAAKILRLPALLAIGIFAVYVGAVAKVDLISWLNTDQIPLLLAVVGVMFYGASFTNLSNEKESEILRIGGFVGPTIGLLINDNYYAITANGILAGLIGVESTQRKQSMLAYISGGVAMMGLSRLLDRQDIEELQIYTHLWAGYFAVLAWFESQKQRIQNRDVFTIIALVVLTVPALMQALEASEAWRGLLLIFESIALIFIGIASHYKLVMYWGVGVLVIEVLYQTRSLLFAVPKYLISLLLGVAILGAAIYFLNKRGD